MLEELINREANILLASLDEDNRKLNLPYMDFLVDFGELVDKHSFNESDFEIVCKYISKIKNSGILSPLTLNKEEFDDKGVNKRYPYIHIKSNRMYNTNAFNCYVRAMYDHETKHEIQIQPFVVKHNSRVYISKGGALTGEYFENCIIRKEIIRSGSFTIQSIINIPVCEIIDKNGNLLVVDHREPKFKVLCDFYQVNIQIDKKVKEKKYDIRRYIKN